jgi:hypothetical protein
MDGTAPFRQDATFCPESGKGGTGSSFHSYNYPTRYLRHFDSATSWTDDVSWAVSSPWVS